MMYSVPADDEVGVTGVGSAGPIWAVWVGY